ncbi:MAG: hypothetical protein F6K32_24345 [Desertifilum sp. SIO1I2]|nr:hypothetical protein [Desertifilum sp. SIO1I2]
MISEKGNRLVVWETQTGEPVAEIATDASTRFSTVALNSTGGGCGGDRSRF